MRIKKEDCFWLWSFFRFSSLLVGPTYLLTDFTGELFWVINSDFMMTELYQLCDWVLYSFVRFLCKLCSDAHFFCWTRLNKQLSSCSFPVMFFSLQMSLLNWLCYYVMKQIEELTWVKITWQKWRGVVLSKLIFLMLFSCAVAQLAITEELRG